MSEGLRLENFRGFGKVKKANDRSVVRNVLNFVCWRGKVTFVFVALSYQRGEDSTQSCKIFSSVIRLVINSLILKV